MFLWNWVRSLFGRKRDPLKLNRDIEVTFNNAWSTLPEAPDEDETPEWLKDVRSVPGIPPPQVTTAVDPDVVKRIRRRESSAR